MSWLLDCAGYYSPIKTNDISDCLPPLEALYDSIPGLDIRITDRNNIDIDIIGPFPKELLIAYRKCHHLASTASIASLFVATVAIDA